jgi:hypothetical protein
MPDVTSRCEICGEGYAPDERMKFGNTETDHLIKVAYQMISSLQTQLSSAECVLAKLMEVRKNEN